jgi:hypothetical protein
MFVPLIPSPLTSALTSPPAFKPQPRGRGGLNDLPARRYHGQPRLAAAAPHTRQPPRCAIYTPTQNYNRFSVPNAAGTITITAEEIACDRATCNASFQVSCANLSNTHWFSKPDPLLKLSRALPDGSIKVISQLPVLRSTVAPSWPNMEIKSEDTANNNLQQPFRLEIWDSDGNRFIGFVEMTFNELLAIQARGASSGALPLRHPSAKAKGVGRCGGGGGGPAPPPPPPPEIVTETRDSFSERFL